ncbi:hypothetical protein LCGC14_2521930 [marine sediment metagenome]|uniref:Uncharacterized protein n=1 Tax=marine sediment metagenome TaxID=412755 RepID=A0A0F9AWL2_9ZZZZ
MTSKEIGEPAEVTVCKFDPKCGTEAIELHPCPYQEEINDDSETLCRCCGRCKGDCTGDI